MIPFADLSESSREALNQQITEMYRDRGFTSRQIVDWLAQQGIARSYGGVSRYFSNHRISKTNGTRKANGIDVKLGEIPEAPTPVDPIDQERRRLEQQEIINTLRTLQRSEAKRQAYIEAIASVLQPYKPLDLIPIETNLENGLSVHHHALIFSDWHVGQSTPIEHTGGLYEQTTAVTKWQVDRLLTAYKSIFETESHGQFIKELLVIFDGDLVENDAMRPAQLRQIDMPVMRQMVETFDLAQYVLRQLLQFPVERVEVHFVGGNHDRTTSKPGLAGLGETDYVDTYSYAIGEMLKRFFEQEERLRIVTWETFFGYTKFGGKRLVFEHGASFKGSVGSYGGIPWYPIVNAAGRYKEMLDGADLVIMGHFHKPAILPNGKGGWIVMNGSLPATTHYVQSSFKGIREPMQWLLDFHEEHGLVAGMPLYAVPDLLLPEGEAWQLADERTHDLWVPRA